ncbi:MAG: type II secretion system F family protein [bacterium]
MAETKKQSKSSKAAASSAAAPAPAPAAASGSVADSIRQTLAAKTADELPGAGVGGASSAAPPPPPPPSAASSNAAPSNPFARSSRKPDPEVVNVFLRQLSVLLSAGIPLMRALQILSTRSESAEFRASLTEVMTDVERGIQLWAALAKHPRWFNNMIVSVIRTGEESGSLVKVIDYLANYRDRESDTKRTLSKAVTYPLIVFVLAIAVVLVLLVFVIPVFKDQLEMNSADLPTITRIVFGFSNAVTNAWAWIVLSLLVAYLVFLQARKRGGFKPLLHRIEVHLPIFGPILTNIYTVQFSTMMSILLQAGVPLLKTLDLVGEAIPNILFQDAFRYIRGNVERGRTLHESFLPFRFLPSLVLDMVAVGEESGRMPEAMAAVASHHQREVDYQTAVVGTLVEPLLLGFMGVVVLFVALSMFLPYFRLIQVVQ